MGLGISRPSASGVGSSIFMSENTKTLLQKYFKGGSNSPAKLDGTAKKVRTELKLQMKEIGKLSFKLNYLNKRLTNIAHCKDDDKVKSHYHEIVSGIFGSVDAKVYREWLNEDIKADERAIQTLYNNFTQKLNEVGLTSDNEKKSAISTLINQSKKRLNAFKDEKTFALMKEYLPTLLQTVTNF